MGIGIIVCGLNGAGKSTLGKVLAQKLNYYFIDNEELYFPKTDPDYLYASPRTKNEVEKILLSDIKEHEDFVYAAVKCDYETVYPFFQYAVLIDVPKDVRIQRVKNRSYEKFGKRMLPGGDLYEREERFFQAVEAREENVVKEWLQSLKCPVIQVDGTKPIEENVGGIMKELNNRIRIMLNPWEEISLSDYENHMKLDSVMQLQNMNKMMKNQFDAYPVRSVMILGIAGGNGLEHIDRKKFQKVCGVDINREYLAAVRERYSEISDILECIQINLREEADRLPQAELLVANLLIEYIGYDCFVKIAGQVQPGYISCIIQINTSDGWVSDSPYIHVFDNLDKVHHQIEAEALIQTLKGIGYQLVAQIENPLPNEKKLLRLDFAYSRKINEEISLVKYYPDYETTLEWYQDLDVCRQVDNRDEVYDLKLLKQMYQYLSQRGQLFYIEYQNQLCGDVCLQDSGEINIVIAKPYQNKHIGRRVINEMIKMAREHNRKILHAEIYDFNYQSQRMFESVGFVKADEGDYIFEV